MEYASGTQVYSWRVRSPRPACRSRLAASRAPPPGRRGSPGARPTCRRGLRGRGAHNLRSDGGRPTRRAPVSRPRSCSGGGLTRVADVLADAAHAVVVLRHLAEAVPLLRGSCEQGRGGGRQRRLAPTSTAEQHCALLAWRSSVRPCATMDVRAACTAGRSRYSGRARPQYAICMCGPQMRPRQ